MQEKKSKDKKRVKTCNQNKTTYAKVMSLNMQE